MATTASQLQGYLPTFVAQRPMLTDLFSRDAEALDQLAADRLDTFEQMFVETGTWGLKFWEVFLGLDVNNSLSTELRRAAIRAKIQASRTLTVARLREMFEAFGYAVTELVEDTLQYRVLVKTAINPGDFLELMSFAKALQIVFPAHLDLIVVLDEGTEQEVVVNIDEIGDLVLTADEKHLYILGESKGTSIPLQKVYQYDAKTLEKLSEFNYGTTYSDPAVWSVKKSRCRASDETLYLPLTKQEPIEYDGQSTTAHINYLATINGNTGQLTLVQLNSLLGESMLFTDTNGNERLNSINDLELLYSRHDDFLYLIYHVGSFNPEYDYDSDTRQWTVARINPRTMTLVSKTLIPRTTHVTKLEYIDTSKSYPWEEQTTWFSDCYGSNVQVIHGDGGDYLLFIDRQIRYRRVTTQQPPATSPTSTVFIDTVRKNPLVQLMTLAGSQLRTVRTPQVLEYARRFGGNTSTTTTAWNVMYKNVKTNANRQLGLPIHFPAIYPPSTVLDPDGVDLSNSGDLPQYLYVMLSINPVTHELIGRYETPYNYDAMRFDYWQGVGLPLNITEDMTIWLNTKFDPKSGFSKYYQDENDYGHIYLSRVFGALRYPYVTSIETDGVEGWEEELATQVWLGQYTMRDTSIFTEQNNANLVFMAYDTLHFAQYNYSPHQGTPLIQYGRQLKRTAGNFYNKYRLWSLLGY